MRDVRDKRDERDGPNGEGLVDFPLHTSSQSPTSFSRVAWLILECARPSHPAHPLADDFHPPYLPIASQSISRDVPLARARVFGGRALREHRRSSGSIPFAFHEQEDDQATHPR
jgi:hypothetical protein